jgi:YHS domain-containing protein
VAATVKVKDPVCGMTIEDSRATASGVYDSETVYFCSAACKAQYDRSHAPRKG